MKFSQPLKTVRNYFYNKSGSAAVEFAIAAPVLLLGLVIVTDLGLAIRERMSLDQATRAGADFAMNGADQQTIENLVTAAARGVYGSQPGDVNNNYLPIVTATETCECPNNRGVVVSCTTICTSANSQSEPPYLFWSIMARQQYDGLLIPDFRMQSEIKVQVR
ncbi:MAG: TadE/TadG family type IV pilus assembly protein [Parvularculaceae bacterium]